MSQKIKIDSDLYLKLSQRASEEGYSSTDEFIIHVLEGAVARSEADEDKARTIEKLKGLGYLG